MSKQATPLLFDEFFESGLEESVSPFLTPTSRNWGRNLLLKASIASLFFLIGAFATSFYPNLASLSALLLVFVYFLAGIPKLIDTIGDIINLEINIDVLMTLAAFLSVLIGSAMEGGLLLVLFALSGAIENAVTTKAKSSLYSLHKLAPTKACVVGEDGRLTEKHIRDVKRGTTILVRAGEIVPLDGRVIDGASSLSLAHLTGEGVPILKKVGDTVPAGSTNMEGVLTVNVTHTSADSTLARIIQLITHAQESRPRFQRWLDRISHVYSLSIISFSALLAATLPLFTSLTYFGEGQAVYRALAFLIAASPCALIIALPIAYLSAVSACARRGILLKGGITLDALASCSTIAFDKTGTLTTGQLTCLGIETLAKQDLTTLAQALAVACTLEINAVHPIAQAIQSYAKQHNVTARRLTDFRALPGYGLEGRVNGSYAYIGHPTHLKLRLDEPTFGKVETAIQTIRERGELVSVLLYKDAVYFFRFQDTEREGTATLIKQLKNRCGLTPIMLTGDHHANAQAIAQRTGIDEYYADLRPQDKLEHVTRLAKKIGLAMVGDGINDAPALTRATAGISMGKVGSRTAIDASDVVLLQDDLTLLSWLWEKSRQTVRIVKQNVALAALAILAASLFALLGWIPLWLAVILHEGGTVVVGLNSLRLLR